VELAFGLPPGALIGEPLSASSLPACATGPLEAAARRALAAGTEQALALHLEASDADAKGTHRAHDRAHNGAHYSARVIPEADLRGEIESALLDHTDVAQCVVVTRAEREDDVRLVGYVVAKSQGLRPAAVREHLQSVLPEYMVPQHLVVLESLPLLPNGKVDRNALPAPAAEAARAHGGMHQPPATEEEKVIAEIWSKLLGVEAIERGDNFFELGGHSLLAMRAVNATEQRLGLQIAPRRLVFETLRQVANPENAGKP